MSKEWEYKNRERHLMHKKALYDKKMVFVREYKESAGCKDCGGKFPHYVLDFDHINDKKHNVSRLAGGRASEKKIKAELMKCEVVCANCHRKRTWERKHPL